MLLSRYNNIDYIENMNFYDGIQLINKAMEKGLDSKLWDMWISIYPNMDNKTYISFDKFKEQNLQPDTSTKKELTKEEIIAQAENIRRIHQKRGD